MVALMGLSSCALFSNSDPIDSMSLFADIAIPKDMVVNRDESLVHDRSGGRLGIVVAKGYMVEKNEVLDFYRREMPLSGWRQEGEFNNDDRSMLVFTKDNRSVAITVAGNWILSELEINVNVRQP